MTQNTPGVQNTQNPPTMQTTKANPDSRGNTDNKDPQPTLKSSGQLRWGIASTGRMASLFVQELHQVQAQVVAVSSRELSQAQAFAHQYQLPYCFDSLAEMIQASAIDILYVSSPNHLHLEVSQLALQQGVHVLCEKPAALDPGSLAQVLAQNPQVAWMEGYMFRIHPAFRDLQSDLQSGVYGEIQEIRAQFGIELAHSEQEYRYQAQYGGGCLLDLGVYGLSAIQAIIGLDQAQSQVQAKQEYGVDVDTQIELEISGVRAHVQASFERELTPQLEILTSLGHLKMSSPWIPSSLECQIQWSPQDAEPQVVYQGGGGVYWGREALHFEELIAQGQCESPAMSRSDSIALAEFTQALKLKFL